MFDFDNGGGSPNSTDLYFLYLFVCQQFSWATHKYLPNLDTITVYPSSASLDRRSHFRDTLKMLFWVSCQKVAHTLLHFEYICPSACPLFKRTKRPNAGVDKNYDSKGSLDLDSKLCVIVFVSSDRSSCSHSALLKIRIRFFLLPKWVDRIGNIWETGVFFSLVFHVFSKELLTL